MEPLSPPALQRLPALNHPGETKINPRPWLRARKILPPSKGLFSTISYPFSFLMEFKKSQAACSKGFAAYWTLVNEIAIAMP
jgi:hypothetical protein